MFIEPPKSGDNKSKNGARRRRFIKGVGGAGLTGLIASMAGCMGEDDDEDDGDDGNGGSGNLPDNAEEVRELEVAGYPPDNVLQHDTLTLIADEVEKLGFNINYRGLNRERQLELFYYSNEEYDIASGGYTGRPDRLDPHFLLYNNYHSSQTPNGNYNWTNFSTEETDQLLDEQTRTLDQDARREIILEAQEKLMEIPPGEMPIEHSSLINVTNTEDFEGFVQVPGLGLKNFWTWTEVTPTTDRTRLNASVDLETPWITPLWSNEANLITQRLTHDKLARISREGLPEPWLAQEWTVSDDNTTITMPLRDGFTFHDGTPLTAQDVKFTFEYLEEEEVPFFASAVAPIESVEAPDDETFIMNLNEPFAPIFTLTLARVHILPEHIWENVPEETGEEDAWQWSPTDSEYGLVGSGPFVFNEWRKGDGVILDANPDHPMVTPNVDSIYLREIQSASGVTSALQNKEIDFMIRSSAQPNVLDDLAESEDHLTFTATDSVGYDEWSMNTIRPPLDKASVRGAMSAMIPKETIANEIWGGYATPAHSPVSPAIDFWYNEDVKKWPEVTQDEAIQMLEDDGFIYHEGTLYHDPDA